MDDLNKIQAVHLDVLKEIGNIGAGNAANALSQMIGRGINMDVPSAFVSNVNDLIKLMGNEEDIVTCISLEVTGDAPSSVLFVWHKKSALNLVDSLMGLSPGTYEDVDENAQSALQEIGNILTGSILNSLSFMTGLKMNTSVPAFACDMLGAVVSAALLERGYFDENIIVIETCFRDLDVIIDGYFFMLPQLDSLDKIFEAVGVNM